MSFRDGPIDGVIIRPLARHCDHRGWLMELWRSDELPEGLHPAMAYLSSTLPGAVRGPHEHREQTDVFAFVGPGLFRIYLWDTRNGSATFGCRQVLLAGESEPRLVVVPAGVVHAYKNVSSVPAWMLNFPNRLYAGQGRREQVDQVRHEDQPDNPFILD